MLDYSKRKCYGFVKNKSEEFIINETEASNVKLIFECFLNGMSLSEIVNELSLQGIPSPSGKETWSRKVISSTLSNEKYHLYGIISIADFEAVKTGKTKRTTGFTSVDNSNESSAIVCDVRCAEKENNLETIQPNVAKCIVLYYNSIMQNILQLKRGRFTHFLVRICLHKIKVIISLTYKSAKYRGRRPDPLVFKQCFLENRVLVSIYNLLIFYKLYFSDCRENIRLFFTEKKFKKSYLWRHNLNPLSEAKQQAYSLQTQ